MLVGLVEVVQKLGGRHDGDEEQALEGDRSEADRCFPSFEPLEIDEGDHEAARAQAAVSQHTLHVSRRNDGWLGPLKTLQFDSPLSKYELKLIQNIEC